MGGGGRTYPLEGTTVILPQHAPYTDPIEVGNHFIREVSC